MFGGWNFMRLRTAETCLSEGRLDEAFARLAPPEIRDSPRAQKLTAELATALTARARLHHQAGRYRDALDDLGRVEALGQLGEDARALRLRAGEELAQRAARHGQDARAADKVAEDIQAGRLDTGRIGLEQIENAQQRDELREALDLRRQRAEELVRQTRAALQRGDLVGACRAWREARQRHGVTAESDALGPELAAALIDRLQSAWRDGRLEQMQGLHDHIVALREFDPALAGLDRALDLIDDAARRLGAGDYDELRDNLLRLRGVAPTGAWLNEAAAALDQLLAARGRLLASPLSLLAGRSVVPPTSAERSPERHAAPRPGPAESDAALLMLIDGTGSVLVLSRPIVRIGRAGSSGGIEIPIPADIHSHHADIARDGEDYFVLARGPVFVNRRLVDRALLRDGDRIEFGESGRSSSVGARLTFRKPSVKSASATLKLSDRCRLPQDVERVVLLADHCTLGPTTSSHVPTREGDSRLLLERRGDALLARRLGRDGRADGASLTLAAGTTSDVGDLRITVQRYDLAGRGRSA